MRQPEPPSTRDPEAIAPDGQLLAADSSVRAGTWRSRQDHGTDLARRVSGISLVPVLRSAPMVRLSLHSRVHPLHPEDQYPKLLAEFSTEPAAGEAASGRWTRLRITQIGAEQYLCEKTRGPEPLEERSAMVGNFSSAKAFFGGGWVVKELFAKLDPVRFPRWP
jgi:hypothetical protein